MEYRGLFIGLTTIDIQYFVQDFPESNKKIKTGSPAIMVGGPAANASIAFSILNGKAHLYTAIGQNAFSSLIHDDFNRNNIVTEDAANDQYLPPIVASVVTSSNGDRNIFTSNPPKITASTDIASLFTNVNPAILMLDGFYPELAIECAKYAKDNNIPVVIDGGSWKPQYSELLKYTDIAICSADFLPPACYHEKDVLRFLGQSGISSIAISRGGESILTQHGNKRNEIKVEKIEMVDSLGAGDFLHGAFCYYYLENRLFIEALEQAAKLASQSCRYRGTRDWIKYWKEQHRV